MRCRHHTAALVGQQNRQAIGRHDRADKPGLLGAASVCLGAISARLGQPEGLHTVHLLQEDGSRPQHLAQQESVGSNGGRAVAHMVTQIQGIKRRCGTASHARRAQCPHLRRSRPLRYKPVHQRCQPLRRVRQCADAPCRRPSAICDASHKLQDSARAKANP